MKFKKTYLIILVLLILTVFNFSSVRLFSGMQIEDPGEFTVCNADVLGGLKYFAILITILKILIPVFIIMKSGISLANVMISGDDGQIKPTFNTFLKRCFVGAIIFFIPTIVEVIMNLIPKYDEHKNDFRDCISCTCVACRM